MRRNWRGPEGGRLPSSITGLLDAGQSMNDDGNSLHFKYLSNKLTIQSLGYYSFILIKHFRFLHFETKDHRDRNLSDE